MSYLFLYAHDYFYSFMINIFTSAAQHIYTTEILILWILVLKYSKTDSVDSFQQIEIMWNLWYIPTTFPPSTDGLPQYLESNHFQL